jgi:hypothetical protein
MSALIWRPMRTNNTDEGTHPERCGTIRPQARPKVRNFDGRWIVFRQKHVLGNQIGVRGVKGEHRTETANLGFEIAKCDALGVDVLQARGFRVGRAHSVESGMGRTEREEHI